MDLTIVGIDCATDPKKTGLALGIVEAGRLSVSEVTTGIGKNPAAIVHDWVCDSPQALLALDAPLGWPAGLGKTLAGHCAGEGIEEAPNDLFRRKTDSFVVETLGKRPLDVGADKIARTAHAALSLLNELRVLCDSEIPLAWSQKPARKIEAIEVYPAGTLTALGLPSTGYKQPSDRKVRERILEGMRLDTGLLAEDALAENADLLDAAICVLAAKDFHDWKVMAPRDLDSAQKEGWIWVRPRMEPGLTGSQKNQ